MSDPKPTLNLPPWVGGSVLSLLILQLGMLWLQGTMLQRQHEDLLGLREDVQAMAETLEQGDDGWNSGAEEGDLSPARSRTRSRARVARAAYLQREPDEEAAARKEVENSRKSERDAVAKGRDVQDKLSITENIRKADAKAKLEAQAGNGRPGLWWGVAAGLVLVALGGRAWLRRRG